METEKKLEPLVYRVLARADIDQEAPMLSVNGNPLYKRRHFAGAKKDDKKDENGMTGTSPLP